MSEMLELAADMRANGTIDNETFQKITARSLERDEAAPVVEPMSKDDIRHLRENARMSQAAFARYLNLTTSYVAQLERGARRPSGAALMLLNVIRRKGIEALL